MDKCDVCNRIIKGSSKKFTFDTRAKILCKFEKPVKIYIQHTGYGCDTGCCGHKTEIEFENKIYLDLGFQFEHNRYTLFQSALLIAKKIGLTEKDINMEEYIEECD